MDSMVVGLNTSNPPLFPHEIFNHHQQHPDNLLSLQQPNDNLLSFLPHRILNQQREQPNDNLLLLPHQIFSRRPQQLDNLPSLLPHQIFNHQPQQQPDNLSSQQDGVTSIPRTIYPIQHRFPNRSHVRRLRLRRWLDVDNMPYEELMELQERIGNVNTGLSVENITTCLKTRTVTSGDVKDVKIFNETCIVCQDEYKDNDTIGTLECRHEYHRKCIKEWLLLKNVCPICKRPALSKKTT